ncbi:MAG: superoxide dismutase family protein [Steroidobacter sp.]
MRRLYISSIAIVLSACGQTDQAPQGPDARTQPDSPAPDAGPVIAPGLPPEGATVQLAPTQGNTANGSLALARAPEGVRITGAMQGLKPDAQFGFHIHEKGDCSAPDASSAGGHFNPRKQPHGDPAAAAHHAGDMVNIRSDSTGVAEVDTTAKDVNLHTGQPGDVLGKAIVVHESPDDYATQPSGNSGARIACGVITIHAGGGDDASPNG